MPVSNFQIYSSLCEFEYVQCLEGRMKGRYLSINMSSPKCECLHKCNQTWNPICDTSGHTHSNLCMFMNFKCKNMQIDYMGTCCESSCSPDKLLCYQVI
ncbi:unnamed protein product [Dracunculus medinensis]|uniref:Kazal-like domain-containing protein n=1 Tax=Dracunculus medinensis TaxID=318479 RepID=A0A0N4U6P1_DRAME|nr:unnamed protein product [Dracunculus medinensis]